MLGFYKGHYENWDNTLETLSKALSDEAVHLFITDGLQVKSKIDVTERDLRVPRLRDFTDLLWGSRQQVEASITDGKVNVAVTADDGTKVYYVA